MALADSARAIGAVTRLLQEHLLRRGFAVAVGKPEEAAENDTTAKLNLFLYEARFDPSLRNVQLRNDQPAPLWLSLRYLLTAFDDGESSDSPDAHELLGRGLSAIHDLNFLRLDAGVDGDVRRALEHSPEPLKITFEETPADLVSKVMQGAEERYRLSVAFQVRPVMIVPSPPPAFAQLVGIDYTTAPPSEIGADGVVVATLASLGPRLEDVEPSAFEPGAEVTITGEELHLSGLECLLAGVQLAVLSQRSDRMVVRVEGEVHRPATTGPIADGGLSAGEHALLVRQPLPNGRFRTSNPLLARLGPVVTSANLGGGGDLTVTGTLLGTWDDDVLVALTRNGVVARLFEPGPEPPPAPAERTVVPGAEQQSLSIAGVAGAVPPGDYLVMVRVNGQQARMSPYITVP